PPDDLAGGVRPRGPACHPAGGVRAALLPGPGRAAGVYLEAQRSYVQQLLASIQCLARTALRREANSRARRRGGGVGRKTTHIHAPRECRKVALSSSRDRFFFRHSPFSSPYTNANEGTSRPQLCISRHQLCSLCTVDEAVAASPPDARRHAAGAAHASSN